MIELETSATRIVDLLAPPPKNALAQAPTPTPQAAIDVANASTQAADSPRNANLPNDEASKWFRNMYRMECMECIDLDRQ